MGFKAHSGITYNEQVDRACVKARVHTTSSKKIKIDQGYMQSVGDSK